MTGRRGSLFGLRDSAIPLPDAHSMSADMESGALHADQLEQYSIEERVLGANPLVVLGEGGRQLAAPLGRRPV